MTRPWWLCKAGEALRAQIDTRWPRRQRSSDGAVGDLAHAARKSDHNPAPGSAGDGGNPNPPSNPAGCVRAIDVTAALDPLTPDAMEELVEQIRVAGLADRRIAYVIFRGRIASRVRGWTWRPYTGPNAHEKHAHVSFTTYGDHDGTPFRVPILKVEG